MTAEISDSWNAFMRALSQSDDEQILKKLTCPLLEIMDKQSNADQFKRPEMSQVLKLYLSRIALDDLAAKMNTSEKIFKRALGVDKFNHLQLLVRLKIILEDKKPKRGLLAV